MTRAEQRANERFPLMQESDIEGLEALKYMGMEFDSVYEFNSARYVQQNYFIEGYHQAEKDLALTWEDIREIDRLSGCLLTLKGNSDDKEFYQEVLKRFKDLKK
jgi:hypothetical protein